jgi:hypothetical protein
MVSKEKVKDFLSKINPFVEEIPDITDKISKLNDDENFQNLLGKLGTVGGLFSIGLYLFDKTLENLSDTEKTYYSLINKTAISVAEKIIQEADKITVNDQNNEEILEQMIKIYSFKDIDKDKYQTWNGQQPGDHPIVKDFRKRMVQIIKENNLEAKYLDFVPQFNVKFQDEIKQNPKFIEYQKQTALKNLSKERADYLNWLLKELDKPHPIDKKKATDYYIQNRAIEFNLEEEKSYPNKNSWNMSDREIEDYSKTQRKWTIEDFLSSRETIKFIAAPFGTGKTSFAKYTVIKIAESYLSG